MTFSQDFIFDRSCFWRASEFCANYVTDRLSCRAYSALFITVCKVRKIQFNMGTKFLAEYQACHVIYQLISLMLVNQLERQILNPAVSLVGEHQILWGNFKLIGGVTKSVQCNDSSECHLSTVLTIYVPSLLSYFTITVCKVSK